MKKIKLLLVLPLVALLSCVKVINEDRYERTGNNVGAWYVKNNTDNELKIVAYKHVGLRTTKVYNIWANPQDSTYVYVSVREVKSGKLPQFEDLLDIDSLYICDKDEVVLRKYLQKNKDTEDRNIFREDMWQYYEDLQGFYYKPTNSLMTSIWVYDINEEDLQLKK